jgi:hypothetical protein
MSRLGKMPNWQKWFVILGMLSCSFSGIAYLIGHQLQIYRLHLGSHSILAFHGVGAMLATLALGSSLPFHLKAGLQSKRKRVSGISQLSFLGLLLITGALLYYGSEEVRDGVIKVHWVVGISFFIIFLMHVLIPKRST